MLLKKLYQTSPSGDPTYESKGKLLFKCSKDGKTVFCNAAGEVVCNFPKPPSGFNPIVIGVTFIRLPSKEKVHLSTQFVDEAIEQGWLTKTETSIVINDSITKKAQTFKIVKIPGRYCNVCGEKLIDDTLGVAAREHIKKDHKDMKIVGSGYDCDNYFDLVWEK